MLKIGEHNIEPFSSGNKNDWRIVNPFADMIEDASCLEYSESQYGRCVEADLWYDTWEAAEKKKNPKSMQIFFSNIYNVILCLADQKEPQRFVNHSCPPRPFSPDQIPTKYIQTQIKALPIPVLTRELYPESSLSSEMIPERIIFNGLVAKLMQTPTGNAWVLSHAVNGNEFSAQIEMQQNQALNKFYEQIGAEEYLRRINKEKQIAGFTLLPANWTSKGRG